MDQIYIAAESIIKIEEIKEEPVDDDEELFWDSIDSLGSIQDSSVLVKQENVSSFPDGESFSSGKSSKMLTHQESKDADLLYDSKSVFSSCLESMGRMPTCSRVKACRCPKCNGNYSPNYPSDCIMESQIKNKSRGSVHRKSFTLKSLVVPIQTHPLKKCRGTRYKKNLASKRAMFMHTPKNLYQFPGALNIVDKSLNDHSLINRKKIECQIIKTSFACRNNLYSHIRAQGCVKPFLCVGCKVRFSFEGSLILHMKQICRKTKTICAKLCKQGRTSKKGRYKHKDTKTSTGQRKEYRSMFKQTQTDARSYQCSTCKVRFCQREQLQKHMIIHKDNYFYCSICKKSFTDKKQLRLHKRTHTGEKSFQCSLCEKSFTAKGNLSRHMHLHSGGKAFQCAICENNFTRKYHLQIHMRSHTGERPFHCSICGKTFSDKGTLNRHSRTHTGEKRFQCTVCKRRYCEKRSLKHHMSIHTNEKRFRCTICEKTFCVKSAIKQHMSIHTGERPFHCAICNKNFSRKTVLSRHMSTHTGEKPFQCNICKKRFTRETTVRNHMRVHTAEVSFQCSFCEKSFMTKRDIASHMRIHCGEEKNSLP